MTKVRIIGPKSDLDECVRALHALSLLHIETAPEIEWGRRPFTPRLPLEAARLREKEALERTLGSVTAVLAILPPPSSRGPVEVDAARAQRLAPEVAELEGRVKSLRASLDGLRDEASVIDKYERLLKGFTPMVSRLEGLKNVEVSGLTIDRSREGVLTLLDAELTRLTGGAHEMLTRPLDDFTVGVVLAYPRRVADGVKRLLSGQSIGEIRLPDEYGEMPLGEALARMERRKAGMPPLIAAVEAELGALSEKWYRTLEGLKSAVLDALDEIGALAYAAQTGFTFVIEGWAPTALFPALEAKFAAVFSGRVLVRAVGVEEREMDLIPVKITNPAMLRPFEVFLSALPAPRYGGVDPTPYIALFFPVFFGLIVADAGYGAVMFVLGAWLRRAFKDRGALRDLATVLMVSSLTAVLFGLLFGEFFGDLGERLGLLRPLLFHRMEALKAFFALALGIGAGHVALGLVIGAVNKALRGKRREAGAKAAHLLLLAAFLSLIGAAAGYLPGALLTPGVAVLIAAFAALVLLEGALGPLEAIKSVGNMLSYARIMAVGAASVAMASVANRIGGLSDDVVIGVVAAALIHLLNIVLSLVSPAIQSMRLHYVEFFSKFYEGGGRKYAPFRKR